jgi:hypothetical protein
MLTSLVTGIELQHRLLVRFAQQLPRETEHAGRFANSRHTRDDDMGHVSLLGDDL